MGTRVGRSTLFGIPLQQQWSHANSGDFAPTYYLQTDAPLYYYSFTDAYIASAYRSLPREQQARFDPMITGFNPADMYARRSHPAGAARPSRACSPASASSRIHKEFVSSKVAGETAEPDQPGARSHPRLRRARSGLVVILHNDIDMPFAKPDAEPVYLAQMQGAARSGIRRPRSSGRTSASGAWCIRSRCRRDAAERSPDHIEIVEAMLADPALAHVYFDISWDEVAKYAVARRSDRARRPRCSTATRIASCSAPTRSRPPGRRNTSPCSTCRRRSGKQLTPEASAQGAQGELRAAVRRSTPPGPGLGGSECEKAISDATPDRCEPDSKGATS